MKIPKLSYMRLIICALILIFGLSRAGSGAEDSRKLNIVTSFYPMYIMAINVCGDVPGAAVTNLTPPIAGCLHDYSITASDMKKLAEADMFIANGAGMESFLDKITARYPDMKVVSLSEGIPLIKESPGVYNPHVWVSISDAMFEVKNLGKAMENLDPPHSELYRKNTDNYVASLEALKARMKADLAPFKGRKIITFHEAFAYFAREFDLEIASVIEREPGSEPSAKELAETIDLVRKNGIKSLFCEAQYPSGAARTIARETGAKVYVLDPAVTGPDSPDAYIDIMEKNLGVLKRALP